MPIRMSDLGAKLNHARVEWEGLELNVTYSPSANTMAEQLILQRELADDPQEGARRSNQLLAHILVGWDFMKEPSSNGKEHPDEPEPITEEFLQNLPVSLVKAIWDRINEEQVPNRRKSGR